MGKVYVNQTFSTVTLETKQNLENAQQTLIKYRKPSGETGEFNGVVTEIDKGIIQHKFTEGQLNESGQWIIWAYIVFQNGDCAAGEPSGLYVYEEGC